jgi:hypothetical protein
MEQEHDGGQTSDRFGDLLSSVENIFKCDNLCCAPQVDRPGTATPTGPPVPVRLPILQHDEHPHANDHHAQHPYRSVPSAVELAASVQA